MTDRDRAADYAAAVLRFRRLRPDLLPAELFGEPAWDLLLELFVADAEGRRRTGREISRMADVRPTVLSRWLIHLTKVGLIVGDGDGNLDDPLTLSGKALQAIEGMMEHASALQTRIGPST